MSRLQAQIVDMARKGDAFAFEQLLQVADRNALGGRDVVDAKVRLAMAPRDQLKGNSQSRLSDARGFGLFGPLGACPQS